jgi:hypothetical protein
MSYHDALQLVNKIEVMLEKANQLLFEEGRLTGSEEKHLQDDVRALAGDIYNDKGDRNESQ